MDAIDAAGERGIGEGVAGFVTAENLGDVAEDLDAIDDGFFEETVLQEIGAAETDVVFDAVGADVNCAVGSFLGGSEAGVGHEERAETVPIAFAGGAGNDVVESGEDAVDGFDVDGIGWGNARERIGSELRRRDVSLGGDFIGGGLGGRRACGGENDC